jgi:hypothetical protein
MRFSTKRPTDKAASARFTLKRWAEGVTGIILHADEQSMLAIAFYL